MLVVYSCWVSFLNPTYKIRDRTDWKDYIVSVRELEDRLNQDEEATGLSYNFLSNIPVEIQDIIENRSKRAIRRWINDDNSTFSLLADSEADRLNIISTDTAIGHNSFTKDNIVKTDFIESLSFPKISIGKIASAKIGFTKSSVSESGSSEIDISKVTLTENGVSKINPLQITSSETTFIHTRSAEFSEAQVTFTKPTSLEIGIAEVGFLVNSSSNDFAKPVSASKVPSSEVFLPSGILFNQLFSIHNPTSPLNTGILNANSNTSQYF